MFSSNLHTFRSGHIFPKHAGTTHTQAHREAVNWEGRACVQYATWWLNAGFLPVRWAAACEGNERTLR